MQADHELTWPAWVPVAAAIPAVTLAVLTPLVHFEGERTLGLYGLLALATLPWLLEAAGWGLPRWLFGGLALVPIATLNWAATPLGLDITHDAQLSLMLLVWTVGCMASTSSSRSSLPFTGLALLVPFGRFLIDPGFDAGAFWAAGMLLAALTGAVLHRQQHLLTELRSAQSALASEAAAKERQRIAREVHDVIAHHLTVTMLHLTGARMAMARDPGAAQEALAEAERLGRQALGDIRRTVGLLRQGDGDATAAALPGAGDIGELVGAFAAAGMTVDLDCTAELTALSPAAGLALYRCVQEALSNAAKHAAGAGVSVSIRDHDGRVLLRVSDEGGAPDGDDGRGLGLLGMRQRVEALGGVVDAGSNGQGWVVACSIPAQATAR